MVRLRGDFSRRCSPQRTRVATHYRRRIPAMTKCSAGRNVRRGGTLLRREIIPFQEAAPGTGKSEN
jgi:hypothetical protein